MDQDLRGRKNLFTKAFTWLVQCRLSIHFSKMAKRDSTVAENIMSRGLEISAEMDTETLRGGVLQGFAL